MVALSMVVYFIIIIRIRLHTSLSIDCGCIVNGSVLYYNYPYKITYIFEYRLWLHCQW